MELMHQLFFLNDDDDSQIALDEYLSSGMQE